MINAGAIASAALVAGTSSAEKMDRTVSMLSALAGRPLIVNEAVYRSESDTGHRNRAIAYLLRNAGVVGADVDDVVDRYFMQCSVEVGALDLAIMAGTLANGGRNPRTGEPVLGVDSVRHVLSVMSSCGMYDYAGSWLYRVGMPAKSGVAGGVIAVLPGQIGIGVYSPRLDSFGNSVRGVAVCEALSEDFGLHMLRPPVQPGAVMLQAHTLAEAGSKRRRTAAQMRALAAHGGNVHVLRLQGPLAFSTAEVALRQAGCLYVPGSTIVFDCSHVGSVDAAASRLFQRFANIVAATDGCVVVAGARQSEVWQGIGGGEGGNGPLFFPTIDGALEWCEDRVLSEFAPASTPRDDHEIALEAHPMVATLDPRDLARLAAYLERVEFPPGARVVRQGDIADSIFFIVAGTASVHLNLPGERRHRLTTMGSGSTFGELALVDDQPRTADVEAETPLTCYVLTLDALGALDVDTPSLRHHLMRGIAGDLADRLRRADVEIMTLAS